LAFCLHYSVSAEDCPGHFYLGSAGHFPDPAFGLYHLSDLHLCSDRYRYRLLFLSYSAGFGFVAFLFPSAWQFHNFSGSLTVGILFKRFFIIICRFFRLIHLHIGIS
jgi:hypothetical protein